MADIKKPGTGSGSKPAATTTTTTTKETKRAKFQRLGGVRMGKALKAIDVLGNVSGSAYEYTSADVDKMRDALNAQVTKTLARFAPKQPGATAKVTPGFTF